jgi:predicted nucleic acid-binding protein
VKFIVDANFVFSALLNTNGKIGDLLINSHPSFQFIAPDFLRAEIRKNHGRLVKISGMTLDEVMEAEFQICKDITFISEEQIKTSNWMPQTN